MSPTETPTNTKREIQVEVPAAEVARETDTLIQKYQKLARIPGFRRGHVPASVIKQRFSEDIKSEVVDALVPRFFRKEADKQGLIPVSQPRVSDLHIHDGEPLRFKATFEVMPEIKVEGYKELRADKPAVSVTDEEVEESLKGIQEQRATFTAVEGRALADGDFAQVSLDGKPKDGDGKPNRYTWTTFWWKLPARRRCRSLPKICAVRRQETRGLLMCFILRIFRTSGSPARLSPTP